MEIIPHECHGGNGFILTMRNVNLKFKGEDNMALSSFILTMRNVNVSIASYPVAPTSVLY